MATTRPTSRTAPSRARGERDDVAMTVDAFRRILRELRRSARKTELATGLSAAQSFVLTAVRSTPGSSLNDIAALTMTDRTSVAAIVERLLEDRYVTRARSDDDRRRLALTITARGQRALDGAAPPPTKLLLDGVRGLPDAQRAALSRALTALVERMGIADQPAGMLFEDAPPARKKRR